MNRSSCRRLYLIEILHQTTTLQSIDFQQLKLYLIEILHQTTTPIAAATGSPVLYLIEILHQTTTYIREAETLRRCILSKFYIKPQLRHDRSKKAHVVSYRNSTSNHNWKSFIVCNLVLYLIEILHQTTTFGDALKSAGKLYLIEILHQTTTLDAQSCLVERCILSKFYIKPQPRAHVLDTRTVVSYRNSTSNHNHGNPRPWPKQVVSYRNSTSNHNTRRRTT